jgi:hypothetical protein
MEIHAEDLPTTFDPDALVAAIGPRIDVSEGGCLVGPGTETSDSIPALLPLSACVLNAETVRRIGRGTLDAIVRTAVAAKMHAELSAGEYVIPPLVVSILGRELLHAWNTAGNLIRDGHSLDVEAHAAELQASADEALAILEDLAAHPDIRGISEASQRLIDAGTRENARLAMGGVMAGAMADQLMRGDELSERRKARAEDVSWRESQAAENARRWGIFNARAEETHAQTSALKRFEVDKAKRDEQEAVAVRDHLKAWAEGRQRIQSGDYAPFQAAVNEYNTNEGAFGDGYKLLPQNTPNGPVLNHIDTDGNVKAQYGEGDALRLFDAGMSKKLEFISPHYFEAARKETASRSEKEADRKSREKDRKSTRLNSSHRLTSRMPSSA